MAIGRPGLLKILREPLPDGLVRCGRACTGYAASGDRVRVHFEDGPDEEGDVLIGADGIHSVVRHQLLGEAPTRYAGYTCWRGVVDIEGLWDPRLSGEHLTETGRRTV